MSAICSAGNELIKRILVEYEPTSRTVVLVLHWHRQIRCDVSREGALKTRRRLKIWKDVTAALNRVLRK